MRKHRYALRIAIAFAVLFVVVSVSTFAGTQTSATSAGPKESCSPCASSLIRSSLMTRYSQVTPDVVPRASAAAPLTPVPKVSDAAIMAVVQQQRARLVAFAQAVNTYQLVSYSTAVTAAQESAARAAAAASSASERRTESMSQSSTTTPTPVPSSDDNSAIWACIIRHESGGDPTAVNRSSGAAGLFQFEVPTWLGNGGGQYAPTASEATPAEQWAIAEATQASDGWSPWIGDGCTPLG